MEIPFSIYLRRCYFMPTPATLCMENACMFLLSSFLHTCMRAFRPPEKELAKCWKPLVQECILRSFFCFFLSLSFFLQTCLPLSISSILFTVSLWLCRVPCAFSLSLSFTSTVPLFSSFVSRFSPLFQSLLQLFSPQASAIASHFLLSQRRSRKRKTGPQRGKTRERRDRQGDRRQNGEKECIARLLISSDRHELRGVNCLCPLLSAPLGLQQTHIDYKKSARSDEPGGSPTTWQAILVPFLISFISRIRSIFNFLAASIYTYCIHSNRL